jgi:uncharacterized protein YecE (DUF72 family)
MTRIGTSGYSYKHWRDGVFYPPKLPQKRWLEFYAEQFDTVELNVTFYRVPPESTFKGWLERTPDDFLFAVKGMRIVTHMKRLAGCGEPVEMFRERISHLRPKVGVVLWQLPPRFAFDAARFGEFLKILPTGFRHALEVRDESWLSSECYKMCESENIAFVIADWPFVLTCEGHPAEHPRRKVVEVPQTADFVYIRRHGATALYASCYSDDQLRHDAEMIRALSSSEDVFCYFNNDAEGFAVRNALALKGLLSDS